MIHDAELAGPRLARMVKAGAIHTESGASIPAQIDTICMHGDTPEALEIARSVRAALEADGVAIKAFDGHL